MVLFFKRSKRPIWFLNNFIQFSMQYTTTIRSSRSQMFFKIGILKVCNIYRKTPVLESLFSKFSSLEACNFIKRWLQHRFFLWILEVFKKIIRDNFGQLKALTLLKNAFYFTSKDLLVLMILSCYMFLSWLFGHAGKCLDKKDKVNFKFYDVGAWLRNNCNTHITQYLEK